MKKLLLLFAMALMTMSASAVTIWVNGTKITGTTGFSIGDGTVNYNADTKTLSLNNVSFSRSGSGNEGIYNVDVSGLTIKFTGSNYITIANASCLVLGATTKVEVASGITTLMTTAGDQNAIALYNCRVTVTGAGSLSLVSTNGPAIQGREGSDICAVTFSVKNCDIYTEHQSFYNLKEANFNHGSSYNDDDYSSLVRLMAHSSSSYAHASDVTTLSKDNTMYVWEPTFNMDLNNINSANYATKDFVIRDANIAVYINSSYFPDGNFQDHLLFFYPRGFIMHGEINNHKRMIVDHSDIFRLTGIGYFTALEILNCNYNDLTELPQLPNTIRVIGCAHNQFTTLSITDYPNLEILICNSNSKLKTLNCSNNPKLNELHCYENQFTEDAMTTIVNSLPTRSSSAPGILKVLNNTNNNEGNVFNLSHFNTAIAKHWIPKRYNGTEWVDINFDAGDVNGDGSVNAADVTALYNYILNGDETYLSTSDVNNDNAVNAGDVTAVYNIILGQN